MYPRNWFLRMAGLMALIIGLPKFLYSNNSDKPLNFVFVMADDLGWTGLSCYADDLHETPNIDRLADQGILFTNAYASATISSPTRASLLTGKSPAQLHYTTWREDGREPYMAADENKLIAPQTIYDLPIEEVTYADVLNDDGYYTVHVGKWHVGGEGFFPEAHGFDLNIGGSQWGAPDTYWAPFRGDENFGDFRYIPGIDVGLLDDDVYLTDLYTDKAIYAIENAHGADKPFFINLWYYTPHTPIEGKEEYIEKFRKKAESSEERMRHTNYEYAAMVKSLDENVGRIMERLDDLGIADHTVVVVYSDNGGRIGPYEEWEMTADHYPLRSGKGALYEGGIRVPLIIRWPGVTTAGSVSDVPVTSYDFYPTFLEMANLTGDPEHNAHVEGVSMVPVLQDPSVTLDRENLFWHYPHYYFYPVATTPVSAMRSNDWKLLFYYEDSKLELYNLEEDIGEQNNLADVYPEKTRELFDLLREWRDEVNAQLPRLNPKYVPEEW